MSNNIFNIIKFCPFGFKQLSYPVEYCSICRGYLNNVCTECLDKNLDPSLCVVIKENETYFHKHCYIFNNNNIKNMTNNNDTNKNITDEID